MRDAIIFAIIFGTLPFVFKRPTIGIMLFTWVSLMSPHRLTYGAAYGFPFAAVIGVVTLIALFARPEPKRLPMTPLTVLLILFMCWMTLTTFSAFEPERAWGEWNRVMKTLFFVLVTMAAINNVKDTKLFVVVVTLSLAFYGFKGGLFTIMSGGTSRVLGPDNTYITDNNDLAMALLTTVPLIWYLQLQAHQRWLRMALIGLALLTMAAVLGSYSRGALLGFAAMLGLLWMKSGHKGRNAVALLVLLPLVVMFLPEQWFGRMETINDFQEDASALGRINSWYFAFNLASDNLMGGGFLTFAAKAFALYAPNPLEVRAPHSIYFQVLGEHGFIGLALFLSLLGFGWRSGSRIIKFCKDKPELKWARDLAAMSQVSLAGYAVGGAFLSLAYYDLLYDILIIVVLLEKVLHIKSSPVNPWLKQPATSPSSPKSGAA